MLARWRVELVEMTAPNRPEESIKTDLCFGTQQSTLAGKLLSREYLDESIKSYQLRSRDRLAQPSSCEASESEPAGKGIDKNQEQKFDGELFLIGGAAQESFSDLVSRLPKDAKVVTVGLASKDGDNYSLELARDFERAGIKAENITALCLGPAPPDAAYKCLDKLPEKFDLVYFGGGDQSLLKQRFLEVDKVRQALKNGSIVAGTSAGTAVMSSEMITGGDASDLTHAHGFALLPWAITDTHVHEREREDRDLSALYDIGEGKVPVIGIDEDTRVSLRWENGQLIGEVGGEGAVHIFRTSDQDLNVTSSRVVKPQLTYVMDGAGKGKAALVWELKAGDKFVLQ